MNLQTLLIAGVVAVIFIAIVGNAIRNMKNGKSSCACGGDCSKCSHCSH